MEKAQVLSVPDGESKSSFVNSRIRNLKEIENMLKNLDKDSLHFDKETAMRINAVTHAVEIIKARLKSTKKKDS